MPHAHGPLRLRARYVLNHKSKTTATIASQHQDVLRQRGPSAPIAMSSIALRWLRVDPLSTHTPSAAIKNYKATARLIAAACGSLGFYAETSKERSIGLAAVGSAARISPLSTSPTSRRLRQAEDLRPVHEHPRHSSAREWGYRSQNFRIQLPCQPARSPKPELRAKSKAPKRNPHWGPQGPSASGMF
jgi:hypothetical protein